MAGLACVWLACVGDEAQVREEEPPPPPSCPPERTSCSGVCIDTLKDVAHCGACDAPCAEGEGCNNGTCELCASGTSLCAGQCVDTMVDPNHCGDCDMPCVGQLCAGGSCQLARDCKELHAYNSTLPDGVYDLDPAGDGEPFAAYCDMTIDGGGWTLVASVADQSYFAGTGCHTICDPDPATTCDPTPFESTDAAGDVNALFAADHKSPAYASVPFEAFLFVDSNGNYATYTVSGDSVFDWYPLGLENYVGEGTEDHPTFSYPVETTNLDVAMNPCGTLRVAFNVSDSDSMPGAGCHSIHIGPNWSHMNNDMCYWDEAGVAWTSGAFYGTNATTYRLWLVR